MDGGPLNYIALDSVLPNVNFIRKIKAAKL